MATKGIHLVFPLTVAADIKGVRDALGNIKNAVGKEQITLKVNLPSTIGKSLIGGQKGQESFFGDIMGSVGDVGKLTQSYVTFADKKGKIHKIFMQEAKEYRDANGQMIRDVTALKGAEEAKAKAILKGWAEVGKGESVSNFKKQLDLTGEALNKEYETMRSNSLAAERYLKKSENMRGPQVKAAQAAAKAVIEEGKALKLADPAAKDFGDKVERARLANEKFRISLEGTKTGANVFQNLTTKITNALTQTIAYSFSIGLVYKAQQLLNDSIRYAIDLNKEMVKIQVLQVEGAKTPEDINNLADAYNRLGQAMGASTLEIARGSVEWLRQGKTIEETQELLRSTLMLSKLGAMDSADATNYLTAITNAFKINALDTVEVVDRLIAVDNIAATSAGELATAMRYTSESAQIAGVSIEQLVSYIGTVSTVTRQNAEMIGQAFKTMFARMTQIQGGGVDEEGMTISKVEASLKKVNIAVKEADGSFRNMGDVLEETAAIWDTLSDRQQVEIATAVAGVRQKEAFLVLMDNMGKALEYQAAQFNASGLAVDRYGIYLESVEAKQGKLKAQMEALYTKAINSETIKKVLDLASGFLTLLDSVGGVIPVLGLVIGIMIKMNSAAILGSLTKNIIGLRHSLMGLTNYLPFLTGGIKGVTNAMYGLTAAIPYIGIALIAITLAMQAYNAIVAVNKKRHEEAAAAVEEFSKSLRSVPETLGNAESIIQQAAALQKQSQQTKLTAEEQEKLNTLMQELNDMLPSLDWKYLDGRPIIDATKLSVQELKEELIKLAVIKAGVTEKDFAITLADEGEQYRESAKSAFQLENRANLLEGAINSLGDSTSEGKEKWDSFIETLEKGGKRIGKGSSQNQLGSEFTKGLLDSIKNANTEEEIRVILERQYNEALLEAEPSSAAMESKKMKWAALISMTMGESDFASKAFMASIEEQIALGNRMIIEAYKLAEQTIENEKNSIGELEKIRTQTPEDYLVEKLETENKAFEESAKALSNVTDAFMAYQKVAEDADSSIVDTTDATMSFLEAIEKLNIAGLETKSMGDFMKDGVLDTSALEDYRDQVFQLILENSNLKYSNIDLYNSLVSLWEEAKVEIQGGVSTLVQGIRLSGNEFASLINMTAGEMWELAQQEQIILYDSQGTAITTSQNLQAALRAGLFSYSEYIRLLTLKGSQYLTAFNSYLAKSINYVRNLSPYAPGGGDIPWGGGGGGGGGGSPPPNPRIKQIEEEIEALNKQKEALQDRLKEFKKYIDLQKESLKRAKEEDDYLEESAKKHKNLGKLKAQIALLALDDSEEAQARRLELEEEASELEEEIAEDTEDRKYELQIQALEDVQKAFEESIQKQIDAIEDLIDALNEEKDALQDVESGSGGSYSGVTGAAIGYGATAQQIFAMMKALFADQIKDLGLTDEALQRMAQKWADQGLSIDQATAALQRYLDKMQEIRDAPDLGTPQEGKHGKGKIGDKIPTPPRRGEPAIPYHAGGIVASHGEKDLSGTLKSNELFAKLMKGEYVATEGQMNRFMKDVLPRMAIQMSRIISPATRPSASGTNTGDINFNMEIHVAGSLDKAALPELKKTIMKEINKTLESRGIKRTANNFSV